MNNPTSWVPTKKVLAALVGSVGSILVHFGATDFTFGETERGMIVAAVSALVLAYFKQNDSTPGGVPTK